MTPLDVHITRGDSLHPRRYFAAITDSEATVTMLSDDDYAKLAAQIAHAFIGHASHAKRPAEASA